MGWPAGRQTNSKHPREEAHLPLLTDPGFAKLVQKNGPEGEGQKVASRCTSCLSDNSSSLLPVLMTRRAAPRLAFLLSLSEPRCGAVHVSIIFMSTHTIYSEKQIVSWITCVINFRYT